MYDKLIIPILFLGVFLFEKDYYYLYTIFGILLLYILSILSTKDEPTILAGIFTLLFGIISIFGYYRNTTSYITLLVLVGLILGFKFYKVLGVVPINIIRITFIGITFTMLYILILTLLGFKLEKENNVNDDDDDYDTNKSDYVCGLYKNNNFVEIV